MMINMSGLANHLENLLSAAVHFQALVLPNIKTNIRIRNTSGITVMQIDIIRHNFCSAIDGKLNVQAMQWIDPKRAPTHISMITYGPALSVSNEKPP